MVEEKIEKYVYWHWAITTGVFDQITVVYGLAYPLVFLIYKRAPGKTADMLVF